MSPEQHAKRAARIGRSIYADAFAAGRLAGIREAAETVIAVITIPGDEHRSDDMMLGIAKGARYTAARNKSAILALAEGKEG